MLLSGSGKEEILQMAPIVTVYPPWSAENVAESAIPDLAYLLRVCSDASGSSKESS